MARIMGLNQMLAKKHKLIEGLPEEIERSFGSLPHAFIMIVWGGSGNGKSNFLMQFLKALMVVGKVLYIGLEEGFEASMQQMVLRHFDIEAHSGAIEFADHEMTLEVLMAKLKRKKSAKVIIIDSLQYWNISYDNYKELKELFPNKIFIFISHAKGKEPFCATGKKIRYDAGIKVRVEGFVAFPVSRYGGNKPYVIYEDGAVRHWRKKKVNEFKK